MTSCCDGGQDNNKIKEEKQYCGFVCGEITKKQEFITNEIRELKKVNPEFAEEFKQRMIAMLEAI